jgi:hypothetical protein
MLLKSVRTTVWISFAMAVLELLERIVAGDSAGGTPAPSSGDSK